MLSVSSVASTANKQPSSRMCFVCGESNPAGVHVRFYEQEDGSVLARFTGDDHHQGYPDRMHGGVITAVLDETIGRAINVRHGDAIWGVTAELTVRFRKPVPLEVELTAVGRIVTENRRLFQGSGEIRLPDGPVAAEASGKFIKLEEEQLDGWDTKREEWYVRPD